MTRRLLLVVSRPPWPPRKGDQLRAIQTLEALTRRHRVTLLAPRATAEASASRPEPQSALAGAETEGRLEIVTYRPAGLPGRIRALIRAIFTGRPLQNSLFRSRDLLRSFRRLTPQMDGVVIQLARLADLVDEIESFRADTGSAPPVVVDLIDSLDLNFSRRAVLDRPGWRPLLRLEQRRLARAEARVLATAQRTVVVSPRDEAWLHQRWERRESPTGSTPLDRLVTVPLAVEAGAGGEDTVAGEPRWITVALTGNLGYFPTAHAAHWWLERVWPELAERDSRLRLVLAGARPGRRLIRRVAGAPRATLLASPPDLKAVLAQATLAVAPLAAGSGVPVKVLEAWATGVPVVASPWAAAGTGAVPDEDLLLADSPGEWVDTVLRLARDLTLRRRLVEGGRRRLETDHSPRIVREAWLSLAEAAFGPGSNAEP